MTKLKDDHSQIRIRRYVEDGQTYYEVSIGFWIHRGTRRVWHVEHGTVITYHNTLAEAKQAAAAPELAAYRDDIRRRRKNPPVLQEAR